MGDSSLLRARYSWHITWVLGVVLLAHRPLQEASTSASTQPFLKLELVVVVIYWAFILSLYFGEKCPMWAPLRLFLTLTQLRDHLYGSSSRILPLQWVASTHKPLYFGRTLWSSLFTLMVTSTSTSSPWSFSLFQAGVSYCSHLLSIYTFSFFWRKMPNVSTLAALPHIDTTMWSPLWLFIANTPSLVGSFYSQTLLLW